MKVMRSMRRILILTAFASLWGQVVAPKGLPLKATPSEYEFSGEAGKLSIGASYMGRSFANTNASGKSSLHDSGNFIVVEVGAFAGKTFTGELLTADFRLKLDGKKAILLAAAPGLVANGLRNRDMDPQRRRLVFGGGMGDAGVMVGQPRPQARFPGDPRPGQQQPVGTITMTDADHRDWDAAIESALVEGSLQSGRAGNLYFEYSGKMTKVKSLVLEYEGAGGKLDLKLR
jgi:hypothetical protein